MEQTPQGSSNQEELASKHPDTDISQTSDASELAAIRDLLRPLPTPGLVDWGIPPETIADCDFNLQVSERPP